MKRLITTGSLTLTVAALAWLAAPAEAEACGGMFCDNQQQPMPVDQTGEVILFRVTADEVEAHIQIQYDPNTEASRFAWIVPVTAQPEITVGSEQLFLNAQNATVPAYGFQTNFEPCGYGGDYGGDYGGGGCSDSGGYGNATGAGSSAGMQGSDGDPMMGGTTVLAQDSVGAFDYAILESQTVDDLMIWLADNEYYQDPVAAPILDEYIQEGHLFVAFRLTQGSGLGEIHPIVLTYPGNEPCVPIRLTRIAAQQDMDIRAFFLGDDRFAPTNYQHVVLNPVKLDWFQFAVNYKEVVTLAIDEPEAGGHAFVTEYAGSSAVVPTDTLVNPAWDAADFLSTTPLTVVDMLASQALYECQGDTCEALHPLVPGLLAKYVPVPDGVDAGSFYSCVMCFQDLVDMNAWDAVSFSTDLQERVIAPAQHAVDIVTAHPYLTRLYTTLSPAEMTIDPVFHVTSGLDAVDRTNQIAINNQPCSGAATVEVAEFPAMRLTNFQTWPDIAPDEMPWSQRIEQVLPLGSPQVLVDNKPVIEQLIETWNEANGGKIASPPAPRAAQACDDDGGAGGCGCTQDERPWPGALAWLSLGGLLLLRRRRDAARSSG